MATSSKSKATAAKKNTKKATASKTTASKATTKTASAKKSTTTRKTTTAKASAKAAAPKKSAPKAKKSNGNGRSKTSDLILTHDMIASKAYHIWAENGYMQGMEMQNWLQAESELRSGM